MTSILKRNLTKRFSESNIFLTDNKNGINIEEDSGEESIGAVFSDIEGENGENDFIVPDNYVEYMNNEL
jgi:hypothetical protein